MYLSGVQESCYYGSVRIGDISDQRSFAYGQLTNGTDFRIGYVEICINGTYRTVCNQDLSTNVASVLCSSSIAYNLGYPSALYGDESDFGPVKVVMDYTIYHVDLVLFGMIMIVHIL